MLRLYSSPMWCECTNPHLNRPVYRHHLDCCAVCTRIGKKPHALKMLNKSKLFIPTERMWASTHDYKAFNQLNFVHIRSIHHKMTLSFDYWLFWFDSEWQAIKTVPLNVSFCWTNELGRTNEKVQRLVSASVATFATNKHIMHESFFFSLFVLVRPLLFMYAHIWYLFGRVFVFIFVLILFG